jgi:hypothetical protein
VAVLSSWDARTQIWGPDPASMPSRVPGELGTHLESDLAPPYHKFPLPIAPDITGTGPQIMATLVAAVCGSSPSLHQIYWGNISGQIGTPSYSNMPASRLLPGQEKSPTRSCEVSGVNCNIDDTTTVIRTAGVKPLLVQVANTVGPFNLGFPVQQQISS